MYRLTDLCIVTFNMINGNTGEYNYSDAQYLSYEGGGIIDATDLPKDGIDTTHQFIRLTVYKGQGQFLGYALIYNLNYGK